MFVKFSVISILSPLPARANVTVPPEYEYLSYLRYRHASGPSKSMSADWVLSFMPGKLALAASFDQMARNIIFESKKLGQNVEVWSLARRASCLTDAYGVLQGVKQSDAHVTVHTNYYYSNKTVNGKDFAASCRSRIIGLTSSPNRVSISKLHFAKHCGPQSHSQQPTYSDSISPVS
ncbi:hypothetical protein CF335_g5832 [Tilletia laevis]|uniref:Uncharacterized protein n=1 Tax=Tilletia caries TaxID=13290 RepID=A0ABN7ISP5_9BASI|nr:hypothetical protein CF335_g5832 [Tilletia laevis]CAD6918601.1 unnamed protein product [Tilletia caries]